MCAFPIIRVLILSRPFSRKSLNRQIIINARLSLKFDSSTAVLKLMLICSHEYNELMCKILKNYVIFRLNYQQT